MKIRIVISVLILFFSFEVFSQEKYVVYGVVKDIENNSPMIGVAVYVESLSYGTVTGEDGRYELTFSQKGDYMLRFSFVGYKTEKMEVKVVNGRQSCDVMMSVESKMLDDVVVSSQRKDENVKELVMSVQKLDMVKIRKIPALMGEVDVIKAIQLLPGVQAASEGSSNFSIRGGNPDQNLILLDDAPIYNASHFLGFFSVFNNDVVKNATLYKGDIPAIYPSRLSSVLNVSTLDEIPSRFTVSGGIGLISSRLMLNAPFNKNRTSVMLAGRTTYLGLFIPLVNKDLKGTNLYFYDLNAKIIHTFNDKNRLFISSYFGRDSFFLDKMLGLDYGNFTVTTRWNHIFNDKLTSNLSLLYTDYDYRINIIMQPYLFDVTAGINDYTLNYDFTYLWNDKVTSKFGLSSTYHNYLQGKLNDETGAVALYLGVANNEKLGRKALEHALYFSTEHKINPVFSIRYGLRLSMFQNIGDEVLYLFDDNHRFYDSIVYGKGEIFHTEINPEPRVAIMYRTGAFSSIKASYSRTVQYAQVATNSTGGLPFDMWFPTNPNIKPQKCDQFTIGYFHNFHKDEIETSVEFFYKRLTDVIDFVDDAFFYANVLVDGEVRIGKGRSYGMELLLRKNYGKFTGWISYTYSRAFRTIDGISHGEEYRSPYDRPHNLCIVLNYQFNERLDVSANWIYNTGQPITYPYATYTVNGVTYSVYNGYRNQSRYPDYHRLDFSMTWKGKQRERWQGEWNLSIYNVYGRHNTWAVTVTTDDDNKIKTEKIYLFSVIPSISYNFKF